MNIGGALAPLEPPVESKPLNPLHFASFGIRAVFIYTYMHSYAYTYYPLVLCERAKE